MRVIDADELYLKLFSIGWLDNYDREEVLSIVEAAPADHDIERVIHCKDCCYWQTDDWATMGGAPKAPDGQKYARCQLHNYYDEATQSHFGWCPKENEYCSLAERK